MNKTLHYKTKTLTDAYFVKPIRNDWEATRNKCALTKYKIQPSVSANQLLENLLYTKTKNVAGTWLTEKQLVLAYTIKTALVDVTWQSLTWQRIKVGLTYSWCRNINTEISLFYHLFKSQFVWYRHLGLHIVLGRLDTESHTKTKTLA